MKVTDLLQKAVADHASDIFIIAGLPPSYRANGRILREHEEKLMPKETQICVEEIYELAGNRDISNLLKRGDDDFSFAIPGLSRFRVSAYKQRGALSAVIRVITFDLPHPEDIGIPDSVMDFSKLSKGLVLVTGPAGSGKSTTLYAALSQLAEKKINCVTVEDPVEKLINGVTQVQVNAKAGLTFATALRSILRQDPDVIMVGEIRDEETADIGVRAAVTGHLVLSTLHTNDCVSAVYRLQNMGIPFYMIAAATTGVVAQRLVKVLCPHCRRKIKAGQQTKRLLYEVSGKEAEEVWEAVGCEECLNTGYSHRRAIYEMFELNETTKNMIRDGETAEKIRRYQRERGFLSLQEQAAQMVMNGEMDMEEAEKVIYSAD